MEAIQYPFPITTRISISKKRRIRLPKFLGVPVPFVLVEDTRAEQPWLGLCGLDSLVGLNAECGSLRVVAEYWTMRPTIPMAVCDRHALLSDSAIWLVTVNSWIEVWSESVWQTEINAPQLCSAGGKCRSKSMLSCSSRSTSITLPP